MAELLEATMMVCFGLSWPMNLLKNIKAKSARNMSLQFILLIIFGYLAGITAKIATHRFNYVLVVYLLNLVVVSANVIVYFINCRYDKKAEQANAALCKELSGTKETNTQTAPEQRMTAAPTQSAPNVQGEDEMETYRELNSVTEAGGVVLFGSNTFANLPLGELTQAYRITEPIYNRSIKDIRIGQIENYLKVCLYDLNPRKVFVNLGDADIQDEHLDVESFISKYEWLLYTIHTRTEAEIHIVSIASSLPAAVELNKRLKALAAQSGCNFIDAGASLESRRPTLRLFELMKVHMRNHPINYADAMNAGSISDKEREQVPNDGHSSPESHARRGYVHAKN